MKVYVAGPMSGLPEFNYPAFFAAAKRLAAIGHEPINPARLAGREECKTWLDFMRASLLDLAVADGIALLPGWQDSRGAALERRIGEDLGLDVRRLDEWLASSEVAS